MLESVVGNQHLTFRFRFGIEREIPPLSKYGMFF